MVGGDNDQVRVLDPTTLNTLASFTHGADVFALAWHRNGTHIAMGGFGSITGGFGLEQIRILNYNGTNSLTRVSGNNNGGAVNSVSWRCDGTRLVIGGDPATSNKYGVRIYNFDVGTGKLTLSANFRHGDPKENGKKVLSVDYLPCCSPANICDGDCCEVIHQGPTCFTGNVTVQKTLTVLGCLSATECLTPSDKSIKTDIEHIDSLQSMDVISALEPITYSYTPSWEEANGAHGTQRGFVAQDVAAVLPELVREHDGIAQLDYAKLVVDLVGAVKYLDAQHKRDVAELRALTTALADEVDYLHSQVNAEE